MQVADLYLDDRYTESGDEQSDGGEEIDPPKEIEVSAEALELVTGFYWNGDSNYSRHIYLNQNGVLMYSRGEENETALAPLGEDRFRMLDVPVRVDVTFRRAGEGKATEMVVTIEERDPVVMTAYKPVDTTVAYLSAYEGKYHSEELSADYELFVFEGRLTVRGPDGEETPLTPGIADVFTVEGNSARFIRDENRIVGFVLDSGRVKGLRFDRR
jgi:hypothetical protein